MSRVYLHSKNDINNLNKLMIYLFIPFFLFGFYKNGLSLYINGYINFVSMLKPIILLSISIIVSLLFSKIDKKLIFSYRLISNLMICMVVNINVSLVVYVVLLILINFALKYFKINMVPIFMIFSIIISMLLINYTFYNTFELSVEHSFSFLDFLLGKGYGGVANSLMIMSIVALIVLMLNINYKKQIPIIAFSVYYILAIITTFINGIVDQNLLLNNNVIIAFIFLSNISIYTPYSKGGCYIYAGLLGILTYIFYYWDINIGVYITLCILSFLSPILDKFIVRQNEKHLVEVL